eukprot:COSAG02_NODE_471_length_21662_cov_70.510040_16_plen_167_part_00
MPSRPSHGTTRSRANVLNIANPESTPYHHHHQQQQHQHHLAPSTSTSTTTTTTNNNNNNNPSHYARKSRLRRRCLLRALSVANTAPQSTVRGGAKQVEHSPVNPGAWPSQAGLDSCGVRRTHYSMQWTPRTAPRRWLFSRTSIDITMVLGGPACGLNPEPPDTHSP